MLALCMVRKAVSSSATRYTVTLCPEYPYVQGQRRPIGSAPAHQDPRRRRNLLCEGCATAERTYVVRDIAQTDLDERVKGRGTRP